MGLESISWLSCSCFVDGGHFGAASDADGGQTEGVYGEAASGYV